MVRLTTRRRIIRVLMRRGWDRSDGPWQEGRPMARDLRRDGCRLDVFVYAEVRDWLTHYFRSWAQARRDRGLAVPIAELKGPGRAMARNIAWLCSLCDEDIERIQLEGEGLIAAMDRQPAD